MAIYLVDKGAGAPERVSAIRAKVEYGALTFYLLGGPRGNPTEMISRAFAPGTWQGVTAQSLDDKS